jgi:hypothetical protein
MNKVIALKMKAYNVDKMVCDFLPEYDYES